MSCRLFFLSIFSFVGLCMPGSATITASHAQTYTHTPSPMLTGMLGLNTIPSARMSNTGTVQASISTLDPYIHTTLSFQLAAPLHISLRQSAEVSNINEDANRLFPGMDFKLRLLKETRTRPAISIGVQSAIGHKRMGGEYLTLSKRYKNFDFTAGIGWGRFGSAGHIDNPLKSLPIDHFNKNRRLDGEMPAGPHDWFTGKTVGFFGGVEYFTPLKDISLKFDWGADRYEAEKSAFNYQAAAPWSLGASWSPSTWANITLAAQGTEKLMGRLTLQAPLQRWKSLSDRPYTGRPLRNHRSGLAIPAQMEISAAHNGILLYDSTTPETYSTHSYIKLEPHRTSPKQLGEALIHMANHAGPYIEKLSLTPTFMGLQGPTLHLMRKDIERALRGGNGSPEEIWQNAEFETKNKTYLKTPNRAPEQISQAHDTQLILENKLSLSEEDSGILYRTSILAGGRIFKHFNKYSGIFDVGYSFRLNLKDNLDHLKEIRARSIFPVRSDEDRFARRTVSLDRLYMSYTHSPTPSHHLALAGGYMEEMYYAMGGEFLYRPFGKRYGLGAQSWLAFKRDPETDLNIGLNGDHILSSHVQGWYDIPKLDLTLHIKAGRYLAEDIGTTLTLEKKFKNGAALEAFATLTDQSDFDLFGGTTHSYSGLRLNLPLGGYLSKAPYIPENSTIKTKIAPLGRDSGQMLDNPMSLYQLTEPLSAPHIIRHWGDIVP